MGAYYQAAIGNTMYDTHSLQNGCKLMEHSYLDNSYCNSIEHKLLQNPQQLAWVCDYHNEPDDICDVTWDTLTEEPATPSSEGFDQYSWPLFIVNHSKKVFYSKKELRELYEEQDTEPWQINPLPILTNSCQTSMGGGDYRVQDSRRATWCRDTISLETSRGAFPEDFKDVTQDVLFY